MCREYIYECIKKTLWEKICIHMDILYENFKFVILIDIEHESENIIKKIPSLAWSIERGWTRSRVWRWTWMRHTRRRRLPSPHDRLIPSRATSSTINGSLITDGAKLRMRDRSRGAIIGYHRITPGEAEASRTVVSTCQQRRIAISS